MASVVTNKGKFQRLAGMQGIAEPVNFFIALVTSAVLPVADTNTFGELTQIATGNGYVDGGISLTKNATDFDVLTEDDAGDRAFIQLKDIVWTAASGPIPASGGGARFAVLTDDNVTIGSREVYIGWDLVSDRTISDTQTLTLQDCELRLT